MDVGRGWTVMDVGRGWAKMGCRQADGAGSRGNKAG